MKTTTLGILGGGQLGRMSAMAAARLGISIIIFTPDKNSPASHVALETIVADYDDEQALTEFSKKVDVISYEFENIPVKTVEYLQTLKPVYPDKNLLEIAQDRLTEKIFLNSIAIPTTRFVAINTLDDIHQAFQDWDVQQAILKTRRFGYDGKGQVRLNNDNKIEDQYTDFQGKDCILEGLIDFQCEISCIIARDKDGKSEIYGPMVNEHKDHILSKTIVPCTLPPEIQERAVAYTRKLADEVDLRGVLTLEMFVTQNGEILANEIAPRTHNSGHWSIDACAVSQFENHIRAVTALPIAPAGRHSDCEMLNLIGDDVEKIDDYLKKPNTCPHFYGKSEVRPGRKMGHVTILK